MPELSARLREIVDALPLTPGMRVLEIGCGPGAMAREMAARVGPTGAVLGIDRSAKAIGQAQAGGGPPHLGYRESKAEDFALEPGEAPYDIAVAIRVGALDGRHPEAEAAARDAIRRALKAGGKLYIDGGKPLRELAL
ncbi:MAG TPA: methyltransferase domain-containing protein [Devosia sp.]|jgi:cyclopropane fatty-acyl-phospholipid synthase-like methyltransferase|nr:methyltransferase domain-containing protein [Devosia sp.]